MCSKTGFYFFKSGHSLISVSSDLCLMCFCLHFRGLFIIDPKGTLRQITMNDLPVGRSVEETLRLVQAFQYTDSHGEVCPVGWKPGSDTVTFCFVWSPHYRNRWSQNSVGNSQLGNFNDASFFFFFSTFFVTYLNLNDHMSCEVMLKKGKDFHKAFSRPDQV